MDTATQLHAWQVIGYDTINCHYNERTYVTATKAEATSKYLEQFPGHEIELVHYTCEYK